DEYSQDDPLVAVPPGRVALGGADGVAVAGLVVDPLALVPVHGVVADQHHRPGGQQVLQDEGGQGAAEVEAGPGGAGEGGLVGGAVAGGETAEGAQEVGDGAAAGGGECRDGQQGETVDGGGGEAGGLGKEYGGKRGR